MEFLLNRFKNLLESYGYSFYLGKKLSRQKEYVLNLSNLPADLDFKLLELTIPVYSTSQEGSSISMSSTEIPIFKPVRLSESEKNYLYTVFTEKNYAEKINRIDAALREYTVKKYKT